VPSIHVTVIYVLVDLIGSKLGIEGFRGGLARATWSKSESSL